MSSNNSIRLCVSLFPEYESLLYELSATPSRDRASRLRFLANNGLHSKSPITFSNSPVSGSCGIDPLRIIVLLTRKEYPELFDELFSLPLRDRTSRFRLLAQHGLYTLLKTSVGNDNQRCTLPNERNQDSSPHLQDSSRKKKVKSMLDNLNGALL